MTLISAGIGLNLDNDKPTTALNAALQEMTTVSHQLGREDILAAFFNNFERLFEAFLHQGDEITMLLFFLSHIVGFMDMEPYNLEPGFC